MSGIRLLADGLVDWDNVHESLQGYAPGLAGALFGAAWWVQADSLIMEHIGDPGTSVNWLYLLPGVLATLSVVMINCTRREDLQNSDHFSDEGAECRIKFWLFLSYCVAFGSLFGACWVLFHCKDSGDPLWPGVAGVIQCVLLVASGLVMWVLRKPAEYDIYSF